MNIVFSTNVTGLINMTQAILPIFQGRPDGGQGDIINVGSIAGVSQLFPRLRRPRADRAWLSAHLGREAYPGGSIYCASKAAVRSFTDSLRKELIATRIRVIEIDPGQVETVRRRVDARSSKPFATVFASHSDGARPLRRNSLSSDSPATRPKPTPCTRKWNPGAMSVPLF